MSDYICSQEKDFPRWYTDVILKCELADYSPVKGCMIIRPYGYSIWEKMKAIIDKMIKDSGAKNAYFPLFIPEHYLKKEAEHLEGFSPELAVVTIGGGKELEEKLVIRPTSETIMYVMFSKWIKSWRDLPLLINQWSNIIRWEKRTRLFLRTTEFLWQEGHTAHSTENEAREKALEMLDVYKNFYQEYLAIPVIIGKKSESQKFAGAVDTYTVEAMMQDRKALQGGTTHFLGQNFSKPFDIQYLDIKNEQQYVWQTSWGVSTRMIGAVIMVHGDNQGLMLPPSIAPIQAVIIPIWKTAEEKKDVMKFADNLQGSLSNSYRIHIDHREQFKPGWKFNDWEMRGVPLRIEIGPREIKENSVITVSRLEREKKKVKVELLIEHLNSEFERIQKGLFTRAKKFLDQNSHTADNYDDFKKIINDRSGFISAFWCGNQDCENRIQQETKATIRCIPLRNENEKGNCIVCGKETTTKVVFAKAY